MASGYVWPHTDPQQSPCGMDLLSSGSYYPDIFYSNLNTWKIVLLLLMHFQDW